MIVIISVDMDVTFGDIEANFNGRPHTPTSLSTSVTNSQKVFRVSELAKMHTRRIGVGIR